MPSSASARSAGTSRSTRTRRRAPFGRRARSVSGNLYGRLDIETPRSASDRGVFIWVVHLDSVIHDHDQEWRLVRSLLAQDLRVLPYGGQNISAAKRGFASLTVLIVERESLIDPGATILDRVREFEFHERIRVTVRDRYRPERSLGKIEGSREYHSPLGLSGDVEFVGISGPREIGREKASEKR